MLTLLNKDALHQAVIVSQTPEMHQSYNSEPLQVVEIAKNQSHILGEIHEGTSHVSLSMCALFFAILTIGDDRRKRAEVVYLYSAIVWGTMKVACTVLLQ